MESERGLARARQLAQLLYRQEEPGVAILVKATEWPPSGRGEPTRFVPAPPGEVDPRIVGEARQRAEDQARMAFARRQRANTKPLHDPRPEILDRHIGRGDQVARDRKIIGAFKVKIAR